MLLFNTIKIIKVNRKQDKLKHTVTLSCLLIFICLCCFQSLAKQQQVKTPLAENLPLRIAVAANFAPSLKILLKNFTQETGIRYQLISAATGVLYQQIRHGAPFDLLLSADSIHPEKLQQAQLILANSRKTYAYGQLALYSAKYQQLLTTSTIEHLNTLPLNQGYFAVADPKLAPYGKAAQQALKNLSLWAKLQKKLIKGNNINQTFLHVRSQSATWGMVAYSQLQLNQLTGLLIPTRYYQPITQQLVILRNSKQIKQAKIFTAFILAKATQQKLTTMGYIPPHYISQHNIP